LAFTDSEKVDIICYLGWPGTSITPGSQNFNSIINDRLGIDAEVGEPETLARARKFLSKLKVLDEKLEEAQCRAATSKVDNITINQNEISLLIKERKRCIRELSALIDIEMFEPSGGSMGNICV